MRPRGLLEIKEIQRDRLIVYNNRLEDTYHADMLMAKSCVVNVSCQLILNNRERTKIQGQSSVDMSAPNILRPRVRIPSTAYMYLYLNCDVKRTNILKRDRHWPKFKKQVNCENWCQTNFIVKRQIETGQRVKRCGSGSVGVAVASYTRGPWFESSRRLV